MTFRVSDGMYTASDQLQVPDGDPDAYTVYEHEVLTEPLPACSTTILIPTATRSPRCSSTRAARVPSPSRRTARSPMSRKTVQSRSTAGSSDGLRLHGRRGSYSDPGDVDIDDLPRSASIIAYDQAYYTDMGTNIDGMLNAVSPDAGLWDHLYFDMRGSLSPQSGMVLQFSGQPTFTYVPNPGFTGYDAPATARATSFMEARRATYVSRLASDEASASAC